MRKIMNDPNDFVDEVMAGIFAAYPGAVRPVTADRRTLVRRDAPDSGTVAIVTGGGSGHLPLFLGYVGPGLLSGAAIGNVFSSPSAEQIYAVTQAVDGGAGVLYLYGNYGGDIYNFDLAADLAALDGIATETVLGADDIASAPPDKAATRRGVAGIVFAFKAAGAAAADGRSLEEVARVARLAVDRTRTMGVGLSPTILPAAGKPTFEIDDGDMEIGIGIHGESGTHRGPLESADAITDRFVAEISTELDLTEGARIAVLVNGLGATPLEELFIIYRRVEQVMRERGVEIRYRLVGEYATSLEMAGASVSICLLDDELERLLVAPAHTPFVRHMVGDGGSGAAGVGSVQAGGSPEADADGAGVGVAGGGVAGGGAGAMPAADARAGAGGGAAPRRTGTPSALRDLLLQVLPRMAAYGDELRELDAAIGDGDLGITVTAGCTAVVEALTTLPEDAHAQSILRSAGLAFAGANPSTFAALMGGGLLAAAGNVDDAPDLDRESTIRVAEAVFAAIRSRGGAELGDKTMLDALRPALDAAKAAGDSAGAAAAAAEAATRASESTAAWQSHRGRAAWAGERSVGHRDPGSVAVARFLSELAREFGGDVGSRSE